MKQIKNIEELKALAEDGIECFISLAGGMARSSKFITFDGTDQFFISNYIDDSMEILSDEQLFDRDYTNIGYALNNGALYYEEE